MSKLFERTVLSRHDQNLLTVQLVEVKTTIALALTHRASFRIVGKLEVSHRAR
jgi:hypothetical protein